MSQQSLLQAFAENFLGDSPRWYKHTIIGFLVLNPILFALDPYAAGWVLLFEFILIVPSVATPNGQAAFLFLLTSALAPAIHLSYMRMVVMALPYTVTMTATGFLAVTFLL